jgi:hypothetical protein
VALADDRDARHPGRRPVRRHVHRREDRPGNPARDLHRAGEVAVRPLLIGLVAAALAAGCAAPTRAIPTERAIFEGRAYSFGSDRLASGERAFVLEIPRSGLREDASILLQLDEKGGLSAEILEAARRAPRPPSAPELEEAAALLSPKNPGWPRLREWLAARCDVDALLRALAADIEARQQDAEGLLGDLAEAYRTERREVELREQDARRRNTMFFGLFGWQRGAYSGYSWSFPFHVERYDRSEDSREVVIFPLLSGGRSEAGGSEVLTVPLLAYLGRIESPIDRAGGFVLLGVGQLWRESIAGRARTTVALPLLGLQERATGEDVAADGGALRRGERTSTALLAGLAGWSSDEPGIYRDRGALKTVGRDRSSWRVLPFASYRSDERGSETMLWPLLGFGWGEEDGKGYVRLLYFLRI